MQNINLGRALGVTLVVMPLISVEASAETTPSPAEISQEEAFLGVLPEVELPEEVRSIPGAVNEEFRNCRASWPTEYSLSQKGPEARAYRDIYGFIKVRNVIETQDCSCVGKVASWADVEALAADLRQVGVVDKLTWQQTLEAFETSNELFPIAETMCGGRF